MNWPKRFRRAGEEIGFKRLIEETEAYLDGRYFLVAQSGTEGTPIWAQLNWIAHAPTKAVLEQALGSNGHDGSLGTWRWAVDAVLVELVTLSGADPAVVLTLQRECLIPVELTLMTPNLWNLLPADVASLAITRMRAHSQARTEAPTRSLPPGTNLIAGGDRCESDDNPPIKGDSDE